ncbi:aldo/keto reductase [Jeotgalibacillus proteolyticus]|uniref:2,5-diketo-D-gluconic acid reductase n=1 Tax=Jeotgalibacillus proteolyticus TaxID=2082395 RepID=A0A2S5G8K3_9BACL|nr:aldo/keto reductase [Jeotgalibacillus proteolyticus]PPA69332.1 2,5-diketo-D-gluconic acid reductase [Jeotgalibacillus proteolyticus]
MIETSIPAWKMHDGYSIPSVGFGTHSLKGERGVKAISSAIENGFRLLDTAIRYDNEGTVGEAVRRSGVPREELFLTSKLRAQYYQFDEALEMIEESLLRAGLEYWDLFLLHWPNPKQDQYVEAWKALIQAQKNGWVRSIGVCNFMPEHLDRLVEETGVKPVINQIELHPYFSQEEQRAYDSSHDILTQAWSPLGRAGDVLQDEVLRKIAEEKDKSVGQIILRWIYQLDTVSIPRSSNPERQKQNLSIFDFELNAEEMEKINGLTKVNGRMNDQDPREYEEF